MAIIVGLLNTACGDWVNWETNATLSGSKTKCTKPTTGSATDGRGWDVCSRRNAFPAPSTTKKPLSNTSKHIPIGPLNLEVDGAPSTLPACPACPAAVSRDHVCKSLLK